MSIRFPVITTLRGTGKRNAPMQRSDQVQITPVFSTIPPPGLLYKQKGRFHPT